VITNEQKLAVGIEATTLCLFRLGAIAISRAEQVGSRIQESEEVADEKVIVRVQN
jgi:hypothetical protein